MSRTTKGYLIAIGGTAVWSATAVFIRYLNLRYAMPPLVLAFWRDLFAGLIMVAALALAGRNFLRIPPGQAPFILAYGFVLSIFNALWTQSVALNGAAVSTVLAYSSPAFTAAFAWKIFGESLDRYRIGIILLSILGCVFVSGAHDLRAWQVNPLGIVTGLLSGVAFAAYSLMGKASANRRLNSWTVLAYSFLVAAGFLLAYCFLGLTPRPVNLFILGPDALAWGILFLLALVPTIGGYGLYTYSLHFLAAGAANLIATLEPAFTAAQSYFLLNERFTLAQIGGSLLIILSVILLRVRDNWLARNAAPALAAVPVQGDPHA